MSDKLLHSDFIVELCKTCLTNSKILGVCQKELKFTYLENEAQKNVFKFLYETHDLSKTIPTIGTIGQQFIEDKNTIDFLAQVKKSSKIENDHIVLEYLIDHIKKIRFQKLLEDSVRLYNKQERDEAYELLAKEAEAISNFSFTKNYYGTVFKDFEKRNEEREKRAEINNETLDKIPFGIHQIDADTGGGIKRQSSAIVMASSGGGKSTALRWVGLHNARLGYRVVHFQLEGSEEDCYDLYDAAWTGTLTEDMYLGKIKPTQRRKVEKVRQDIITQGGEIYVYASETFDSLFIEDAREVLLDIRQEIGEIDLIIWDYLEISNVRGSFNGESGERRRRNVLGERFTNLCVEFNAAGITATQASDVSPKDLKNPDFRLTRHHTAEFKGMLRPFSYFLTINATPEQKDQGIAVLYADKYRHHKAGESTPIYQSLDTGRFYNSKKTIEEFLSDD